jgi:hypothetical protein
MYQKGHLRIQKGVKARKKQPKEQRGPVFQLFFVL